LSIGLSFGQELTLPEVDRVIFKNHSQLEGKIIEVSKRWVVIKVGNIPFTIHKTKVASICYQGEVISFISLDKERIKKGVREMENIPEYRLVPIKDTAKRGFYNVTYASFHFRSGGDFGNNEFGFGVENVFGFQFNQYTGLGLGIGYHDNSGNIGRGKIIPIYAEYRGYFSDKKVSPYYSIASGLSFGTEVKEDTWQPYTSTKPGPYFYPAIGFKSGSDESSIMVDVGFRFSQVTYLYEESGQNFNIEETTLNKGFILRIGVML